MKKVLSLLTLAGLATGCDNVLNGGGLSEADVEAIEPGDANGVIFSGTWELDVEVAESTCGGLFELLPGSDILFTPEYLGTPPTPGAKGKETISFAQRRGELTRGVDDLGDWYTFRGGVNQDGTFTYGVFGDAAGLVSYIEIVDGKLELSNGSSGKLEGTSQRRYTSGVIDCQATMRVVGNRTNLGGS
jgi:hypothetical protein